MIWTSTNTGTYLREVMRDRPISYWPLHEQSGTQATDQANSNVATYTGTFLLSQQPAIVSGATSVLFTGGYASGGTSALLPFGDKSVEAWIKPSSITSLRGLVDQEFDTALNNYGGWGFWLSATGKLVWWIHQSKDVTDPGQSVVVGAWQYVAVVWTSSSKTATFYLNGKRNSAVSDATIVEKVSGTATWMVANLRNNLSSGAFAFPGNMYSAATYNYALSPGRIAAHYAAGKGLTPVRRVA